MKRNNKGQFIRQYKVNDDFLDVIKEEQAYFLGIIASDGCIKNNCFSLAQSGDTGLKIIKYVRSLLNSNAKIYLSKKVNSFSINITSNKLVQKLKSFGIFERKTLKFEFPKKLTKKYHRDFLRGYIDGDGSIGIYNSGTTHYLCVSFVGTKKFITKVREFIPIQCNLNHIKRCKNLYELRFYGERAINFCKWLYVNDKLIITCKKLIYLNFLKNYKPRYLKYPEKNKIISLLKKRKSVQELANIYNISDKLLYKWRNKYVAT